MALLMTSTAATFPTAELWKWGTDGTLSRLSEMVAWVTTSKTSSNFRHGCSLVLFDFLHRAQPSSCE